jgi:hypothetical protein
LKDTFTLYEGVREEESTSFVKSAVRQILIFFHTQVAHSRAVIPGGVQSAVFYLMMADEDLQVCAQFTLSVSPSKQKQTGNAVAFDRHIPVCASPHALSLSVSNQNKWHVLGIAQACIAQACIAADMDEVHSLAHVHGHDSYVHNAGIACKSNGGCARRFHRP